MKENADEAPLKTIPLLEYVERVGPRSQQLGSQPLLGTFTFRYFEGITGLTTGARDGKTNSTGLLGIHILEKVFLHGAY